MRAIHERWRLTGTLVLLIAMLPVFTMVSSPRGEQVLAQSSGALRVSYPIDDSRITGDTVPVVWGAGEGEQVALIIDEAVAPASGAAIAEGNGVVIAAESPALLPGVQPGDHSVTVVAIDAGGVPVEGSAAVSVDVTVRPAQFAGIYPGLCSAIGSAPSFELEPVAFAPGGLGGDVWPVADAVQTRSAGVPSTIAGPQSETIIDAPLSDLLERAQVISVSASGIAGLEDGVSAACGEVGGVVSNGVLTIGLRQQPSSPTFGVATLVDQGDTTRVVIETATTDDPVGSDIALLDEGEAPVELPLSLQQGTCASLNADASTELLSAIELLGEEGEGDVVSGVAFATRVLISQTTIDEPITDLLARAASIAVLASGLDGIGDGELVACGEVGGPLLTGVVRVALVERDGSGVQGFATLFAEGDQTTVLVEVFRVGGSNEEADPSPSESPSEAPSESPSASASADEESDLDDDGVSDDVDNCLNEPNEDQADEDSDGIGDACSEPVIPAADADEDGVADTIDNCTFVPNPGQTDADGNGVGDVCDEVIVEPTIPVEPTEVPPPPLDSDGDGTPDSTDNCPDVSNPDQADSDLDGVGDACTVAIPSEPSSSIDPVPSTDPVPLV